MSEVIHSEGELLAAKARDEYIENGKSAVVCPKCHQAPHIDIQGANYSHVNIRCLCGYVRLISREV
ncbi:MAG: hypothetical protein J6A59_01815 [Lachnospiraceae bacterium]|nr:hypothetical protein [Lachnospiraceae bacterium]